MLRRSPPWGAIEAFIVAARVGGGSADVGIVNGDGNWPGLRSRKLFTTHGMVVCAPSMLKGRDPGRFAAQLAQARLLESLQPPDIWRVWRDATGDTVSQSDERLYFDSVQVMYEAAALGLGIAIGIQPSVDPFLASGKLVAPFGRTIQLPGAYFVAALPSMLVEPPVRAFWRWLLQEC